jgi:Mrp family chromosome partitioning ATPase
VRTFVEQVKENNQEEKIQILICLRDQALIEKVKGIDSVLVKSQVDSREEALKAIEENMKFSILVTETAVKGEMSWLDLIRKVPIKYRVLVFNTEKLNQLVYGEMERLGVEFLDREAEPQQIIEIIERLKAFVDEINHVEEKETSKEKSTAVAVPDEVEKESHEVYTKKAPVAQETNKDNKVSLKLEGLKKRFSGKGNQEDQNNEESEKVRKKLQQEIITRKKLDEENSLAIKKLKELETKIKSASSLKGIGDKKPISALYSTIASNIASMQRPTRKRSGGKRFSRVICCYSPVPSGKTFVAANLAVTFANMGLKVGVVDLSNNMGLHTWFGVALDENGLVKAMEGSGTASDFSVQPKLLSNIEILTQDPGLDKVSYKSKNIESLLEDFTKHCDVVIVDMGLDGFSEEGAMVLKNSGYILIVGDHDYQHSINLQITLDRLIEEEILDIDRAFTIYNRFITGVKVPTSDVETAARMAIQWYIPDAAKEVYESIRFGIPASLFSMDIKNVFMAMAAELLDYLYVSINEQEIVS